MSDIQNSAKNFLLFIADGKIKEAYEKFTAKDFIHHNPFFKGDPQSLMQAMMEDAAANPEKTLEIKNVFDDGRQVAVHSLIKQNKNDIGYSAIHIFRFENEKIVELWDVVMAIPENSSNKNGVF